MTETNPDAKSEDALNFVQDQSGLLDQFILFGDSITQQACSQELGFAFQPALQDGKLLHIWRWSLLCVTAYPYSFTS